MSERAKATAAAPPRERGIIFGAPMIRAILDGTKTQTRRPVKLPKEARLGPAIRLHPAPGDRLYVKERHAFWVGTADEVKQGHTTPTEALEGGSVLYRADFSDEEWAGVQRDARDQGCWELRPSIFLPRWASRLTLEVTAVRVERLNAITGDGAIAEGAVNLPRAIAFADMLPELQEEYRRAALVCFQDVWDGIHGRPKAGARDFSWAANPWTWVITFRRVEAAHA